MKLPELTDNSTVFHYFLWIWWMYYSEEAKEYGESE